VKVTALGKLLDQPQRGEGESHFVSEASQSSLISEQQKGMQQVADSLEFISPIFNM
jgi:hypothetical protein